MAAWAGFEKPVCKCWCSGLEPVCVHRIHVMGAGIQLTFTSFASGPDLRCGEASDRIGGAGVKSDEPQWRISMNITKVLGLAAVGALLILAAPAQRAQAMSLANPGAAAAIQDDSRQLTTEVRWHHHWGHRHWHRHWRR
jgi:hypothetical protein